MDVTEPLKPHKGHALYPAAVEAVLAERRLAGVQPALDKAEQIAGAMTDKALHDKIRELRRRK